jgi:DNA-binding transcriptional MerR regulator
MENNVLTREDVLKSAGIEDGLLAEWLNAKLVHPAGFTDDKRPLFSPDALERISHIRKLRELGYGSDEILKIVKKVGLPKEKTGRKGGAEKSRFLTIGSLAERSGLSPRTIKHWEDKGIIEPDMRTEGGFRLYPESYVTICKLIQDLQLFGTTLDEIKAISDEVRNLRTIEADLTAFSKSAVAAKLGTMLGGIQALADKMRLIEEGLDRWQDLLKKKKKDILGLQVKNHKRPDPAGEVSHA